MPETSMFIYCSLVDHREFQVYKLWFCVRVLHQRKLQLIIRKRVELQKKMRSVLAMIVFVTMLVLVLADDSSLTAPTPSPTALSLPQDEQAGGDCGKLCADKCYLEKCIPKHYKICLDLCKLHCQHPLSYNIYHCTSACAASLSTKLGSGTYVHVKQH
jgi:hypothetical protein